MPQNGTWEWLLEGFEFDLETRVKPRTVRYYIDHVRIFVRWAKDEIIDARTLTKRDVQRFFHFLIEKPGSYYPRQRHAQGSENRQQQWDTFGTVWP